jgi:transposase
LREPDEALGRSRGGLSTKVHLVCDGKGRPLAVLLTPGQRHGSTHLGALLDAIRVPRLGQGRPRKRPERLIADKGYDFSTCRGLLRRRGIAHVIPRRREREGHHAGRVGRRTAFDRETYATEGLNNSVGYACTNDGRKCISLQPTRRMCAPRSTNNIERGCSCYFGETRCFVYPGYTGVVARLFGRRIVLRAHCKPRGVHDQRAGNRGYVSR